MKLPCLTPGCPRGMPAALLLTAVYNLRFAPSHKSYSPVSGASASMAIGQRAAGASRRHGGSQNVRYCEQCDYAITDPAITTCPRCGWPAESNAAWQAPDAGLHSSYPSYGASPPWPQMPPSGETSSPYQDYPPASALPPRYGPPSMPFGGGVAPRAPYVPFAPPYRQQPPPGYGYGGYPDYRETGYPAAHPAYPGYANPPAPTPRRWNVGPITVLIVTLLVVLVGGGAAIARLASSQSSVTFSAAPSGSSATATAVAAKAAGIVYQNSFASDATGWGDDQYCFLGAGGYHVTTRTCFAPTGNLTNIDVTVQVKQISGQTISPYGLAIRIGGPSHALNQAYAFAIDSDRKWAFYRCDGILDSNGVPHCTKLVDFTPNDAIRSGLNVANSLEVKAQGSHFDFYVNGVRVGGASDSTYVSGMVGLAAEADAQSVFTNLTVKALR